MSTTAPQESDAPAPPLPAPVGLTVPTPATPNTPQPPPWLSAAREALLAQYPNDRIDITQRTATTDGPHDWRIKCLDCPGKLYTPGPDESLSNFEVHLQNRQHRQRVMDRVAVAGPGS